jgi:subtilisin family serine protease
MLIAQSMAKWLTPAALSLLLASPVIAQDPPAEAQDAPETQGAEEVQQPTEAPETRVEKNTKYAPEVRAIKDRTVSTLLNKEVKQRSKTNTQRTSVTIFFRGGLAGTNIAEVIERLYTNVEGLPTFTRIVEPNDRVCTMLKARNFPSPCDPFLPLIERLSSIKNASAIYVGQKIVLPDVELNVFRSSRPAEGLEEVFLDNIIKNWSDLNIEVKPSKRDGTLRLEFDTFELKIKAPSDAARESLISNFLALNLDNAFVETAGINDQGGDIYYLDESEVRNICAAGRIQTNPVDYSQYTGSVISDLDFNSGALAIAKPEIRPRLFLLDVAMFDTPNLKPGAGAGSSNWQCDWQDWTPRFHATHLAGIVASRENGFGFIGLEPTTEIIAEPYRVFSPRNDRDTQPDSVKLARYNRIFSIENATADNLPIFLMASSYRSPVEYGGNALSEPRERFSRSDWAIEKFIRDEEPLLIVAAGQSLESGPIDIRTITPLAPQNLGDLKNVISVAACVDCDKPTASIDPVSNYSSDGMVHVAAPGGERIPGWVSPDGISSSRGTSQASAFAAGVAARMVARYPRRYTSSERVKRRLQATSRPMVDDNGDLVPSAEKIATGIVDPRLAILDPSRDWRKTANGWGEIRVKRWTKPSAAFADPANNREWIDLARVQRVVRHKGGKFTLYLAGPSGTAGTTGEIVRKHFFQIDPAEDAALELCDGTAIRLAEVLDFLPRMGGIQDLEFGASACP